jgi:predicted AAA+ superfamily ATPase
MQIEVLAEKNPWWKGKEYFEKDHDYLKWLEKKIRWMPKIIKEIELRPFSLNFIFGPRQVGKTTALKLLIKDLLQHTEPKAIFYFRCEEIADYKELDELLRTYLEFRDREKIESSVILLDEITFPKEWWRAIKGFIDDGVFKNDVLILTGSSSLAIKKEIEQFPGRRGHGKNIIMWPLNFKEFVQIVYPDLAKKLRGNPQKDILFLKEINKALSDYFNCGGFPLAINSYFEKGYINQEVKDTYLTWIKNDLAKVGRNDSIAREILKSILAKMPSALSWEGISKEISIKSPKTVHAYINILKELFVLHISYFIDPNTISIKFGKNKKINLADPIYFHIFEDWCLVKIKEKESVMAESILASHLYRKHKEVFYWKNREEIDCIVRDGNVLKGYECKWQEKASAKKMVVGKMKELWTISKKDLEGKLIPLSLFLYSL